MHGIETFAYDGHGYRKLMSYGAWRVAILNAHEDTKAESLATLQKHDETDEVFVLLEGVCTLIVAEGDAPGEMFAAPMLPGKAYNIRRGVWHNHILEKGARVLIVENEDTGADNSPKAPVPYPIDLKTMRRVEG